MGTAPRIAFMTRGVQTAFGFQMWTALKAACAEGRIRLRTFDGLGNLGGPGSAIYDLMAREKLDGILTWAGDTAKGMEFYPARMAGVPSVCLTFPVSGMPVVQIDMYEAMQQAVRHLMQVHGRRRIAFMRGLDTNNYFKQRHDAYRDALKEAGIDYDPRLVTDPDVDLSQNGGRKAAMELLDRRGLRPGEDFDGVLGVSEISVLGLMGEIMARGVRVPEAVSFIGYDNSVVGRGMNPLPTAQVMPFRDQARKGLELLLELLQGRTSPPSTLLKANLAIGASCGCRSHGQTLAASLSSLAAKGPLDPERILETFEAHLPSTEIPSSQWKAVADEARGHLGRFLGAAGGMGGFSSGLEKRLADLDRDSHLRIWLPDLLTLLATATTLPGPGVDFVQRMGVLQESMLRVNQALSRQDDMEKARLEQETNLLRGFVLEVSSLGDGASLSRKLGEWLPRLSIQEAYLVLLDRPVPFAFLGPPPETARLIWAIQQGKGIPGLPLAFSFREVLPKKVAEYDLLEDAYHLPLVAGDLFFGHLVVASGPLGANLYGTLASQVGQSLLGIHLLEERKNAQESLSKALGLLRGTARTVAEESDGIARHVGDVSAAMGEAAGEAREIARRIGEIMEIVGRAVERAEEGHRHMTSLDGLAAQVGELSGLIASISKNANVLSMNARIEAARAGAAGKGFAIVAGEIQKLSTQTRESTTVMDERLRRIQTEAGATRGVIAQIVEINRQVKGLADAIRAHTDRQVESSQSISAKLVEATRSTQEIHGKVRQISELGDGKGGPGG